MLGFFYVINIVYCMRLNRAVDSNFNNFDLCSRC